MSNKLVPIFILFAILSSCGTNQQRENNREIPFPDLDGIVLLGHRGNGNKSDLEENSIAAIDYGMSKLDGVEVDIQLSRDTTLWLFHDFDIQNCNQEPVPFAQLTDEEIEEIVACNNLQLATLDSLIRFLENRDYGEKKYISLDLKCTQSEESTKKFGGVDQLSQIITRSSQRLEHATGNRFVVLSEVADMGYAKSMNYPSDRIFLLCRDGEDCIDTAREQQIGLSLSMRNAIAFKSRIRGGGYSKPIQIWTPNTGTELLSVSELKPDFIQGDQIDMLRSCREMNERGFAQTVESTNSDISISDEFITVFRQSCALQNGGRFVSINLDLQPESDHSNLQLVISKKSESGNDEWRSVPLTQTKSQFLEYFGPAHKPGDETHIYLWNPQKEQLQIKSLEVYLLEAKH